MIILSLSCFQLVALILVALSVATLIIIDDNEDFTKLIDEGNLVRNLRAFVVYAELAAKYNYSITLHVGSTERIIIKLSRFRLFRLSSAYHVYYLLFFQLV